MKLQSLSETVRRYAVAELMRDIETLAAYNPTSLTPEGLVQWPMLLQEALTSHNPAWLAAELQARHMIKPVVDRKTGPAKQSSDAHTRLAEGEFNFYYIRGVCAAAVQRGIQSVEIYRAKQVAAPRPESVALEGTLIDAQQLLVQLRTDRRAAPVPGGPNSGLSVRLPAPE